MAIEVKIHNIQNEEIHLNKLKFITFLQINKEIHLK
jgi:hypothetical protein